MTDQLFAGAAERSRPLAPAERRGRWVLHRAGLLNVWQYDRAELTFAGGRALLRGKNGAGKSKALEVLLPFLLDGDIRSIDATGRDRTTIRWLMTDGRGPGHHVGYAWLELRLTGDDGSEAFCTLGAGLKASTGTGTTEKWFFVTEYRVGLDFSLDDNGECLSTERLKAAIGEEHVTPSAAEHRRRVALRLFGLRDVSRFGGLLHLLHRLRDPNIGNEVEAGKLAEVLSDALPSLDEQVLQDAAGRFDDLEQVKQQLERTEQTASALGRFLDAYRGYTRTVLRNRAREVASAERERRRASAAVRKLADEAATAENASRAAAEKVEGLRREERAGLAERDVLKDSEAYRAHLDLVQREAAVAAKETAAEVAATAAQQVARQRDEAVVDADRARKRLTDVSAEARATHSALLRPLADAGLEPALLVTAPAPGDDGTIDADTLAKATETADQVGGLVESRRRRAEAVQRLVKDSDRAAEEARRTGDQEARAEGELTTRRTEADDAERRLLEESIAWSSELRSWCDGDVAVRAAVDWSPLQRLSEGLPVGRDAAEQAPASAVAVLAPARQAARHAAVEAANVHGRVETSLLEEQARHAALEAEEEARPEPGRHRRAPRPAGTGAPFYELVDVAPDVDDETRAGVEAALEASGILDAWVSADGIVAHPHTEDILLRPDVDPSPADFSALDRVLVAAPDVDSPVSVETVERLLASIGLGEQPAWPTWVTADGRWAVGRLHGAWSKAEGEYLGAGTRRATRRKQLEESATRVEHLRVELRDAQRAMADAASWRDALEVLPSSLPDGVALAHAHADVEAAGRVVAAARERYEEDRRASEAARTAAARARVELEQHAQREGLPVDTAALDAVFAALDEARRALRDHRILLTGIAEANGRLVEWLTRVAARQEAADVASEQASSLHEDAMQVRVDLGTLLEAVGASVQDVLARLQGVEQRVEASRRAMPAADRAAKDAAEEHARVLERRGQAEEVAAVARAAVVAAGGSLRRALILPGVALAALERHVADAAELMDEAVDDEVHFAVALAGATAEGAGDGDDVTDRFILARYDELQEALGGGYDTAADEDDGVKVFHVADDTGRQPLPVVAARVQAEAEEARGRLLAREREVVERFLLRELADEVRDRFLEATDLVTGANRALDGVRTSHAKGARLEWRLREDVDPAAATAARLLVDTLRNEDADAELRDALLALIQAERDTDRAAGYHEHLGRALDYRAWHEFKVRVIDDSRPGSTRTLSARAGLSQGEQRVLSYLALFAAAAAHFDGLARTAPDVPRLLLLDDAFAKIDEPTHERLLEHLVDMDLDFLITSERLWGCFPGVPSLEIYEALRDPGVPGVALVHFHWDGRRRHLVGL